MKKRKNNDVEKNLMNLCLELYAPESKKLVTSLLRKRIHEPHAKMQLICSKYIRDSGYVVDVEKPVGKGLACDVYGTKGDEKVIIEVESGEGSSKREASKAARYSKYADIFVLGIPYDRELKIPKELLKKPGSRDERELKRIREEICKKYKKPPVGLDDLLRCHVDFIYRINVRTMEVKEENPLDYL